MLPQASSGRISPHWVAVIALLLVGAVVVLNSEERATAHGDDTLLIAPQIQGETKLADDLPLTGEVALGLPRSQAEARPAASHSEHPQDANGLTREEIAKIWASTMPIEDVLEFSREKLFRVSDSRRGDFHAKYASMRDTLGRAGLERKLGREIDEAMFADLAHIEAPFNADIKSLCDLYLDDLDYALRDIFANRLYELTDRADDGSFRDAAPGESRMLFPGRAIYWSLPADRYPQFDQVKASIKLRAGQRYVALYQHIDSHR